MFFIYLSTILLLLLLLLKSKTYRILPFFKKFTWKPISNKNIYKKYI